MKLTSCPRRLTARSSSSSSAPIRSSRAGALTRRTARNAAVRAVAEVLGKIATLSWTVAAARMLPQQDFGAFSYALSLMLLASALPAWGFDPILIRRASSEPALLTRLHSEAIAWQSLLAVPTFLAVGLVASNSRPSPEAAVVLVLLLVAGIPELWSDTARASAAARQRQAGVATALVVQRLATAVLIILALVLGLGVVGMAAAFLAGTLLGWGAHAIALRRVDVVVRLDQLSWSGMREMLSGTWLVGLSALVLIVLFRVDTVLLELFRGDQEVAAYAAAYRLLETGLFIAYAVNQAVLPVMSASTSGDRVSIGFERGLAAAAAVYVPFAAVALVEAERIIDLFFGRTYAIQSAPVLRWLAPAAVLFAASYLGVSALLSRRRHAALLAAAVLAMMANIALNLILIPAHGGVGAAIATTGSYLVQVLVVVVCLRRDVGRVRLLRPLAESTAAAVAATVVLLVVSLPLLVELVLAGAAFLAVWLTLARRFAPEQLEVIRAVVPGSRR